MIDKEKIQVSACAIEEYNAHIQSQKPENQRQYSFEKLGITHWEIQEINSEELLSLGTFVETSGVVSPSYFLWKCFGKNTRLDSITEEVMQRENEIPKEAKPWVRNILGENFDIELIEEKIEKGQIDPPLLFYPLLGEKDFEKLGLLNLGNILDGNNRLLQIARYLKEKDSEDTKDFKLTVFVGKVDILKYLIFNAYYISEPWINSAKDFVGKYKGREVEKIDREHIMNFFERWYLLLQRLNFKKER